MKLLRIKIHIQGKQLREVLVSRCLCFWCRLAFVKNQSRYWLASVWCQLFLLYMYEDTNVFHFPRLPFLPVYNPRVATISFDQKRERGFDEQLAHILNFKQEYWAPLVGEMKAITAMYSHQPWISCNWICTMGGKRENSTLDKLLSPLIFHYSFCTNSLSF